MNVQIWSDYVCPFCYIGKRRFEAALEQFPHRDKITVSFKSFELDPNIPRDNNPSVYDRLAAKYGMSREQAIANTRQVAEQARQVGLHYDFDHMIQTNTFDAHRLAHYAATKGKQAEMAERLLKAHFVDTLHIGEHETLADLAAEVGLDRDEVWQMLKDGTFAEQVRADEQQAAQLEIRGVPFFLINNRYAVSGAQSSELFLQALQKAWDEAQRIEVVDQSAEGSVCTDDHCLPGGKEQP